jgi:hypothetical protein
MTRVRWGMSGLAVLGAVLAVASMASATATPPFTATPSYAAYGGLANVGHTSASGSGTGSNTIGTPPKFVVSTGADKQGQTSTASGSGAYGIDVHSGIYNLSFVCSAPCSTGTVNVAIDWNTSWYAHLTSNCPGASNGSIQLGALAAAITSSVIDETTATVAGSNLLTFFSHSLLVGGTVNGGKTSHNYFIKFKAGLTRGDSYTVVTYFEIYTYAHAVSSPAAGGCTSTATARVGVVNPTILESVKVS